MNQKFNKLIIKLNLNYKSIKFIKIIKILNSRQGNCMNHKSIQFKIKLSLNTKSFKFLKINKILKPRQQIRTKNQIMILIWINSLLHKPILKSLKITLLLIVKIIKMNSIILILCQIISPLPIDVIINFQDIKKNQKISKTKNIMMREYIKLKVGKWSIFQ